MAVRILIADDDVSIRRLLRRMLESQPEWKVCGDACDGDEVIEQAAELNPDVVVLDLAMPKRNGLQAAREIHRFLPDVPMLLLTVQQVSTELIREATRVGFRGAVSKDNGKEVVRAIESLLNRQRFFQPVISDAYGRFA